MISYTLQVFKRNNAGSFMAAPDMPFVNSALAIAYLRNLARLSPNAYFIKDSGLFHIEDGSGAAERYSFGWSHDEIAYAEKWQLRVVDTEVEPQ